MCAGGRVSRRGSPMSSEAVPPQAALPPPPPARTRSSEAAPAYSDAGTPVSGTPVSGGTCLPSLNLFNTISCLVTSSTE